MNDTQTNSTSGRSLVGRCFVHPLFDYLAIGGGLSLITTALVLWLSPPGQATSMTMLPWIILLSNSSHFAASTVRLYTKPGTRETLPFVTMALPLLTIMLLTLCMYWAGTVGGTIQMLYLMWSPYHYAAQAYGLGVMYSYRSGCNLSPADKSLYWWIALLPFFYANIDGGLRHLLPQFTPEVLFSDQPQVAAAVRQATSMLGIAAIVLPLLLYLKVWRGRSGPMPLISLLTVITNGLWFVVFDYYQAFVWATVFHGIQYLAIVTIFHAREQCALPGNTHRPAWHVARFYVLSLLLAYGLFNCWPQAYMFAGFGPAESVLMVVAVINIHHFIIDAYIWRLHKGDSNRKVVDAAVAAPEIAQAAI